MKDELVIATRRGTLATAQAKIVQHALRKCGVRSRLLYVTTRGDRDQLSPLDGIGGDGLFVREIEKALISKEADIAVHSAKDLPFYISDGLAVKAIADEADARDVLILKKGANASALCIGTSTARRSMQLKALYPDWQTKNIRGNVTTRLDRLRSGEYDGIILAKAGLDRIEADLSEFDVRIFDIEEMVPAPCQGLIAVEAAVGDRELDEILKRINLPSAMERFRMEREFFAALNADCSSPAGVYVSFSGERMSVTVYDDGKRTKLSGKRGDYKRLPAEIDAALGRT